ncbi:MAG: hypothetical protein IPJ82_17720 [Lewinellaceae bacterium]|nr:hypothetical protein [Lewinellaceae bacterium]
MALFLINNASAESAAWSRTAAKFGAELLLLRWLAGQCGIRFDPVWLFAGKTLLCLAPVALATWLAGQIPGSHGQVFALKTVAFSAGLWWFAIKSPIREAASEIFQLFRFERKP